MRKDPPLATNTQQVWYKALDLDELPEGRVKPKAVGVHTMCMTHFEGEYAALLNKCPHQGGPLGEGSIENGMLRCPWHGWDYHPPPAVRPTATATACLASRWRSATTASMWRSRRMRRIRPP